MKKAFAILAFSTALIGCASTKSIVAIEYKPETKQKLALAIQKSAAVTIPEEQYSLLETQIKSGLSQENLLVPDGDISRHTVTVQIHSFYLREDAARLTVGILAGCDNINSTVTVTDKLTNEKIGSSNISIEECAAWGVASQVITKYTDGVIAYLTDQ